MDETCYMLGDSILELDHLEVELKQLAVLSTVKAVAYSNLAC